jgi:NAD(P)-dependent dehydrogenase (short-subunit alcohol dehydrogenase family)
MNKTIFITGSTDGIGKLAAAKLAKDGHSVYLHGRNPQKLSSVISELQESTGNEKIGGFVSDLSDLEEVRMMVEKIKLSVPQIDVLINNAGVFKSKKNLASNGLDIRLVVNHLSPYLITEGLLELLKPGSRIINLSSAAQASVTADFFHKNTSFADRSAYAQSKLALTMWSFDLAKTLKDIGVIALNPGSLLNTRMVQEAFGKHWSPADKGADIIYDLAILDKYQGETGKYFDNDAGNFGQAHEDAYDEKKIEDLMSKTKALVA